MKRSGISPCMFSCGKATVKVRLWTFLPSACQVVRGVVGQRIQGNALFLFFITREDRGGAQGARWLPIGLSYPFLDDVYGALPSAAEHTALKEAFFNPRESHPLARTLLPSKFPRPPPRLQNPSSFLPCFPWPASKCFMWLHWGRLEVDPCACPQKTLVFQWDEGVLVLAGWSRMGGGVQFMGLGWGWGGLPPGREGNKRTGAFSHALFIRK